MNSQTPADGHVALMVATRKGAWLYHADPARSNWQVDGPHFLGHIINHLVLDPRDGRTLLAAASTGHLGPTLFRSTDFGKSWAEATRPPAFGPATNGPFGEANFLAHSGPRRRAGRVVRRHLAAGAVPFRRRRHELVALLGDQ